MEDTKAGAADKDEFQDDERPETLDCNSEHEESVASEEADEPRNGDAQPTVEFTTKQVISFSIAKNGMKDILSLFIK